MSIVIFSGTTEGRSLSEYLCERRIDHNVCVATQSGEAVMSDSPFANIHVGRLNVQGIKSYLLSNQAHMVIDATHPYAVEVTENLRIVCEELKLEYIRLSRQSCTGNIDDREVAYYEDINTLAQALSGETGNILLTTGSKDLKYYVDYPKLLERLYVRVLPSAESLELCAKANIMEKHIIAMYGPHTQQMNVAVMQQFNIKHLVTKESGDAGGFREKLDAAVMVGARVHVIKRPDSNEGISVEECIARICKPQLKLYVQLVGIGPGNIGFMTKKAAEVIKRADYCFGAKRMLEICDTKAEKIAEYVPEKIIEKLEDILAKSDINIINAAVLFSGDTGLYSGCTKLYEGLHVWGRCDEVTIIPGISSFSAFSAAVGVDYTGAFLESLHGKSEDLANRAKISQLISDNNKVFILMSGKSDFDILYELIPSDMCGEIIVGHNISYDDQQIIRTDINSFKKDIENVKDGLFIVLVNPGK